MTDPQETSDNTDQFAHSDGEAPLHEGGPEGGQSVGGPASTMESSAESALTGSGKPGSDDDAPAEGQAQNPL
jgi:hypothetical protein